MKRKFRVQSVQLPATCRISVVANAMHGLILRMRTLSGSGTVERERCSELLQEPGEDGDIRWEVLNKGRVLRSKMIPYGIEKDVRSVLPCVDRARPGVHNRSSEVRTAALGHGPQVVCQIRSGDWIRASMSDGWGEPSMPFWDNV